MAILSDRLVYLNDRVTFIDQFLSNNFSSRFIIEFTDAPKNRWPAGELIKEHFLNKEKSYYQDVLWLTLKRIDHDFKEYPGAILTLQDNKYLIFRNGTNISSHNLGMLDYQTTKLHFRSNIKQIIDLVRVISADSDELILLTHAELNEKEYELLLQRIKG